MTNVKATKKALLSSVVALLLCFAMLMGTTFAWFTDTATSGTNKIQSGNLKVDIVDVNGTSLVGNNLKFQNKNGETDILWEPGVTFRTQAFQIKNNGNLALKYRLSLNGVTGNAKLLEVITFSIVKADGTAVDLANFEGKLETANALSEVYYIQGVMASSAGNEYQNQTLEGIGVTVVAAQAMKEDDSFGNTYDQFGEYPAENRPQTPTFTVSTAEQLQAAMTPTVSNDKLIVNLASDVELAAGETWTPLNLEAYSGNVLKVVINGNGHTIKGLNAPLIGKAFFGNTSVEINDLTLTNCNIVGTTDYVGAFAAYADNCASVTLSNCHLKDSVINGAASKYTGGLLGYCSSPVTAENCSVVGCTITGAESVGAVAAMFSSNVIGTTTTVSNVTVKDNTLVSNKSGSYRVGAIVGTTNIENVILENIVASGNTCTQAGSTGVESGCTSTEWVGRKTGACTVTGDTSASIN